MPHTSVDVPADRLDDPEVLMLRLQEILFGHELAFFCEPQKMGQGRQAFWSLDPRGLWAGMIQDGKLIVQYNGPLEHWSEDEVAALGKVLPKLLCKLLSPPGSARPDTSV